MKYQVQFTAQARLEFFEAALWWAAKAKHTSIEIAFIDQKVKS